MRFSIGQVSITVHKGGATFTFPFGNRPFNLDVKYTPGTGYEIALFDQTIPVVKITVETEF